MIVVALDTFFAKLRRAYKSWTVRFNAFMAALPFLIDAAQAQIPAVRDYLPTNLYGKLMLALIVGNLLLRFKTSVPLENK